MAIALLTRDPLIPRTPVQRVFVSVSKLYCRLFHGSLRRREFEEVKDLANVDSDDFIYAANRGDAAAVQTLLSKGADVNAKWSGGKTALMFASLNGHREVVQMLLAKGADVNTKDTDGNTALVYASRKGHHEQALLSKGANVNAMGGFLETALMNASRKGHSEVEALLMQAGAVS
jgi:ankyrin repeat protein